jgi:hypothetical protein
LYSREALSSAKRLVEKWMTSQSTSNVEEVIIATLDWYCNIHTHFTSAVFNHHYKVCWTLVLICQIQKIDIENAYFKILVCMRNNHTGHIVWEEFLRVTDTGAPFTFLLLGGPWVLPPPCCVLCTRIIKLLVCTHCTTAKSYKWSDIHFFEGSKHIPGCSKLPLPIFVPCKARLIN